MLVAHQLRTVCIRGGRVSLNRCAKSPQYRQISCGRASPGSSVLSRETVATVVAVSSASLYWNCSSTVAAQAPPRRSFATDNAVRTSTGFGGQLTLYQYTICPFCNKVKGLLDFLGEPYDVREVNALTKAELKAHKDLVDPASGKPYEKVPAAFIDAGNGSGEWIVDSSHIVQTLLGRLRSHAKENPARLAQLERFCSPADLEWQTWCDTKLAVLLFPNITRNFSESYQAFTYVWNVPTFSYADKLLNQVVGATAMWAAQGKIKQKYAITDERVALREALEKFTAQLGTSQFLLGGAEPTFADICVYGCLRAIEGLDTHKDVLASSTKISEWYKRVMDALGHEPRSVAA